ncbi:hypothetical protein OF83DRAFT_1026693, partial [Amylostereum chailletii]
QANVDWSLCNALKYHMDNITDVTVLYDIMCSYGIKFHKRVNRSPYLSFPKNIQIHQGVRSWHIHGHVATCFAWFVPIYIPGVGYIDGEVLETLWSRLN